MSIEALETEQITSGKYYGEYIEFIYTIWSDINEYGYREGEINFYSLSAEDMCAQGCPIAEPIVFVEDDPDPEVIVEAIAEEWEEQAAEAIRAAANN